MDVLKNVYATPVIPTERSEWRDLVQNSEPFRTRQRRLHSDALARKISPLGGLSALLGRNDRGRPVRLRGSAAPPRSAQGDMVGATHAARPLVILSSSSLAHAVSILPLGKMHDLQGGSSSSQKSHFVAIFGSPIKCESKDLKVNVKCRM